MIKTVDYIGTEGGTSVQEIAQHLSDIEVELSELGRKLEEVRQQIRDMSTIMKPSVKVQVAEPLSDRKSDRGSRRNTYTYGSSYRPDRWMNAPASSVEQNGIQETWSVGDEIGSPYSYSDQNQLNMISSYGIARQSEYSIHARP